MNIRSLFPACCVLTLMVLLVPSNSLAVVVFSDGFGDGDIDNNGMVLIPDADINNNGMLGDMITPAEEVFADSPWTELTDVDNSMDRGIRWLHSRGWTGSGDAKATLKLVNDAVGALPDAMHPTYPVPALASGAALGFDSKGRGSSATGMFVDPTGAFQNVALGPNVGDQVKVSFDFRIWLSDNNLNNHTPPRHASLRFGLFNDSDNQLGMTNPCAGIDPTLTNTAPGCFPNSFQQPAVWGAEGGQFLGDLFTVGANGDHGWWGHIDLGRTDWAGDAVVYDVKFDGIGARIRKEVNTQRFLEGSDLSTVAQTDPENPTFTALDVTKRYNLALTFERIDDPDNMKVIFDVNDLDSEDSWRIEGTGPIVDLDSGIASDNWDYFGIRHSQPLWGSSCPDPENPQGCISPDEDDYDFLIDNFLLEMFDATAALPGDYDDSGMVGAGDLGLTLEAWGGPVTNPDWVNQIPAGNVGAIELQEVLENWGNSAIVAVPEPTAAVLLLLGIVALRRRHRI